MDEIEHNKKTQVILIGIMMPTFILHTIIGGTEFFHADLTTCRSRYSGEVFYIITFMFAVSMCVAFVLLMICVMIPTWIENY